MILSLPMANSGSDLASGDALRSEKGYLAYLGALALLATVVAGTLWFASQWGLGVTPDSVNYLKSAEKLLAGQGIFSLKVHWPPGYPTLLAIASVFGSELLETTRLLHAAIYVTNVLLMAQLAAPKTTRGRCVAIGGALFFAASTLEVHFMAWSESPFVGLQLASTLLLAKHLSGAGRAALWASALLAGLSVGVRFAGFPFVGVASLAVLVQSGDALRLRLRRALGYGAIGCGPALAYMLGNRWIHGEALDRQLFFQLPSADVLASGALEVIHWFGSGHVWLGALLAAASVGVVVKRARAGRTPERVSQREAAFRIALVYLPAYTLFILAYMTLLDTYLTFNARILFPAQAFFTVALLIGLVSLAERGANARFWATAVFAVALVVPSVHGASIRARALASEGYGELERSARALPIWDVMRAAELPQIYSNGPDLIYLHVGAPSQMIPRHTLPERGSPNPGYAAQMREVAALVERGEAVVVIFSRFQWRSYLPRPRELESEYGFRASYRARDGIIYTSRGRPPRTAR